MMHRLTLFAVLVVLAWGSAAQGAARTATQNGDWNQSTTWGGNTPPGDGDTANLSTFNVTMTADVTLGTDTAAVVLQGGAGTLTINSGVTFTIKGWAASLTNRNITMGAGSTWIFGTTNAYIYQNSGGTLTCNGTSGSHVVIKSATAGANNGRFSAGAAGRNALHCDYTDFIDIGTNANSNTITDSIYVHNCTTTGCGQFNPTTITGTRVLDINTLAISSPAASVTIPLNISISNPPSGSEARTVTNVSTTSGQIIVGGDVTNLICTYNEPANSLRIGTSGTTSGAFTRVSGNLFSFDPTSPYQLGIYAPGPVYGNVFNIHDSTHSIDVYNHNPGTYEIYGNVFENGANTAGNDSIVVYNDSGQPTSTVYIHHNLNVPSPDGTKANTLVNHASQGKNLTIRVEDNTTYGETAISEGPLAPDSPRTGLLAAFKNNVYKGVGSGDYALQCYNPQRSLPAGGSRVSGNLDVWDKGTLTGVTATTFTDSTATWSTYFDALPTSFWIIFTSGSANNQSTQITGNSSGTAGTVAAWSGATPANGDGYLIYVLDVFDPANVDYNCHYNGLATGTIRRKDGTTTTSVQGVDGYYLTSGTPGAHDKWNTDPQFYDSSRSLATYDTAATGLNNAAGTAWANGAVYAVGNIVSQANSGFYGNATINYRCLAAHTAATATDKPGSGSSWRTKWEYATADRVRQNLPSIDALVTWYFAGYRPLNTALRGAASDGTTPGAVEGQFARSQILILSKSKKPTIWRERNWRSAETLLGLAP